MLQPGSVGLVAIERTFMEVFKVVLGASRIEFSVSHDGKQYVGKVNDLVIAASPDYDVVRATVLNGIWANKNRDTNLH